MRTSPADGHTPPSEVFVPGAIVIATLSEPREKFWGMILALASEGHILTIIPRILKVINLAANAYPTTKIRVNAACRNCPHKVLRMEMHTPISCIILSHEKILIKILVRIIFLVLLGRKKNTSKN